MACLTCGEVGDFQSAYTPEGNLVGVCSKGHYTRVKDVSNVPPPPKRVSEIAPKINYTLMRDLLGKELTITSIRWVNTTFGERMMVGAQWEGGHGDVLITGEVVEEKLRACINDLPVVGTVVKNARYFDIQ